MTILQNEIYQSDIKKSLNNILNIDKLKNTSFLITGATGLVCSAIIDLLLNSNQNINVYAASRFENKVLERFGTRVTFVQYDATKFFSFDINVDYIIHGASNASPNLYVEEPVETMQANICGIQGLLDFAYRKSVRKVLFISSSEIYGRKEDTEPFKENQYGYIDLLNPRSSYSIAKRAAETMCASYYAEYSVPFNVVRLGHIYGPSAATNDKRIASDFAYKAATGEKLILKSDGSQIRSYCYSLDCASAIISVLTSGVIGEAYNISNKESIISIRRMAELFAEAGEVELIFDIPLANEKFKFNPMNNSSLDSSKIESLGWQAGFSAEVGVRHTVQIIKNKL